MSLYIWSNYNCLDFYERGRKIMTSSFTGWHTKIEGSHPYYLENNKYIVGDVKYEKTCIYTFYNFDITLH